MIISFRSRHTKNHKMDGSQLASRLELKAELNKALECITTYNSLLKLSPDDCAIMFGIWREVILNSDLHHLGKETIEEIIEKHAKREGVLVRLPQPINLGKYESKWPIGMEDIIFDDRLTDIFQHLFILRKLRRDINNPSALTANEHAFIKYIFPRLYGSKRYDAIMKQEYEIDSNLFICKRMSTDKGEYILELLDEHERGNVSMHKVLVSAFGYDNFDMVELIAKHIDDARKLKIPSIKEWLMESLEATISSSIPVEDVINSYKENTGMNISTRNMNKAIRDHTDFSLTRVRIDGKLIQCILGCSLK